ncbi:hypothetical protein C7459_10735 [Tumebacillus permanentifrigoris]|uniref:Uncharacterized protein n=1 Tax=Tumebacillus permanentifrigoris TaxID=378543 RepID=A0A316D8S6_9BACL|nr:hypothetical protein C7459_10735 [Tumebacillus permanentifrigoris]
MKKDKQTDLILAFIQKRICEDTLRKSLKKKQLASLK